jgi:HD-like signal output (HDOD) protein
MHIQTAYNDNPVVKHVLDVVGEIMTLPEVTIRVMEIVEDPESAASDLHEIIKRDPALATKVLSVVNSAFYGLPGRVACLERAIVMLGAAAVRNIAVAASMARMFKGSRDRDCLDARALWKHSVAVAVTARAINTAAGLPVRSDEAFLAGLIHDVGLLAERQAYPGKLAEVLQRCGQGYGELTYLERDLIGATHEEIGEALVENWKFPDALRAAIGGHHNPGMLPIGTRTIGLIVGCADILCCRNGFWLEELSSCREITPETLAALRITRDDISGVLDTLEAQVAEAEAVLGSNN